MSRAVAGGVKYWPYSLRRAESNMALSFCLASSAVPNGSGIVSRRLGGESGSVARLERAFGVDICDLWVCLDSTEIQLIL